MIYLYLYSRLFSAVSGTSDFEGSKEVFFNENIDFVQY